ncbi:hypothetical protein RB628_29810 [Streptomyces sp. ADMS]|uniref:hypothetical protein n=1 Tax=Streptomyces sp. ADMS TaxID=3071415 RepID=UPI00296FD4B4|nr:hypothetical protein [Streptomyces sp. ADMS]MDW4909425.1 hypothetical protein [Streptomyces sp. ADMS]
MLYSAKGHPQYVGRSDTDVRRRLLRHCSDRRGDYFTYDVHNTPANAFDMECALFHLLSPNLSNRIHPDRPDLLEASCVFCLPNQRAARQLRGLGGTHDIQRPPRLEEESS